MGVTYCFRKEDHVVIVMPYMEHQAIVVGTLSYVTAVTCSVYTEVIYLFLMDTIWASKSVSSPDYVDVA